MPIKLGCGRPTKAGKNETLLVTKNSRQFPKKNTMPVKKKPKSSATVSVATVVQRRQPSQTPTKTPARYVVSAKSPSKASAAIIAPSASAGANDHPATVDRCQMKCAVCEQTVVGGKDQALLCEGVYRCWHHRYCAGVSVGLFDVLSSSSDPFYCPGCWRRSRGGVLGVRGRGRGCRCGFRGICGGSNGVEAEEGRTGRDGCGGVGGIGGGVGGDGSDVGDGGDGGDGDGGGIGDGGGKFSVSTCTQRQKTTEKTRVEGARRVWVTMR